jgi:hypothetical protein
MPNSTLVTQLFSSLMRVYCTFPPVAPFIDGLSSGVDGPVSNLVALYLNRRFPYGKARLRFKCSSLTK